MPLAQNQFGNLRHVSGARESSRIFIQRNAELPQTVRVMNVEIEILSFDDGEITYTVRRNENFDENEVIYVD